MIDKYDTSFGIFFLKTPFCPKKGTFKGQKQPAFSPFRNYLKELLSSDPKRAPRTSHNDSASQPKARCAETDIQVLGKRV